MNIKEEKRICVSCKQEKNLLEFPSYGSKAKQYKKRKCRVCFRKQRSKWRQNSDPQCLFNEYKRSAIKRKLEFKITYEQFIEFSNKSCEYCGDILDRVRLDRIDNNVGYIKGNLAPCCYECNKLKSSLSKDSFLKIIEKISNNQRVKNGKQK